MPHIVSSKQDLGYASSGTGSCSILDQIGTHPNFNQNEKVRFLHFIMQLECKF